VGDLHQERISDGGLMQLERVGPGRQRPARSCPADLGRWEPGTLDSAGCGPELDETPVGQAFRGSGRCSGPAPPPSRQRSRDPIAGPG